MNFRYPGAKPFTAKQKSIFFGRQKELNKLLSIVNTEELTVLYSKSGLGKSSLLNAGLIPLVKEKKYLKPIYIRFGSYFFEDNFTPLGNTVNFFLNDKPSNEQLILDKIKPENEMSLWYHIKQHQMTESFNGILLIFDQFEELFTYPKEQIDEFGKQLSEVIFTNIPDRFREIMERGLKTDAQFLSEDELVKLHKPLPLKIIMTIRSDRMSQLNKLKPYFPNILQNCFELGALSIEEAENAILYPAYLQKKREAFISPVFDFEDEAVSFLIDFLSGGKTQDIESFQLQLLCEHIERKIIIKQNIKLVSKKDLGNLQVILENYYLGKIADLPKADQLPARYLMEEGLVFEDEERRLILYEGQIKSVYGISDKLLKDLLNTHIIRAEPSYKGGYTFELSHDSLVAPILKAKAKRKQDEQERAKKEAQKKKEIELAELRKQALLEHNRAETEKQLRKNAEHAKSQAEEFRFKAIEAWDEAEKQKKRAEQLEDYARYNERKAKTRNLIAYGFFALTAIIAMIMALNFIESLSVIKDLEKNNVEAVRLVLKNVEKDILNLRYEDAILKIQAVAEFNLLEQEITKYFLEIVFWYCEIGEHERAFSLLDTFIYFTPDKDFYEKFAQIKGRSNISLNHLRQLIQTIDNEYFNFLFNEKYYPELIEVEGGTFEMGCDSVALKNAQIGEWNCPYDEKLQTREVETFEISKYETTVWQFAIYCESTSNSDIRNHIMSEWNDPGDNPVTNVSWYQAVEYANWLSQKKNLKPIYLIDKENEDPINKSIYDKSKWKVSVNLESGQSYRLPTEVEWEYAAKEGKFNSNSIFSGSNTLSIVGWYDENSTRTSPVGMKKSNMLGIYDMCGNVEEWCWDWYSANYHENAGSGAGLDSVTTKVLRGGSWEYAIGYCRVTARNRFNPDNGQNSIGFRVAKSY